MKRKLGLLAIIVTTQSSIVSCGSVSACDCANILDDKTKSYDEASKRALESDGNINFDNDYWISRGRSCMEKYTKMKDWEIEAYQQSGSFVSFEAIGNAEKECNAKQNNQVDKEQRQSIPTENIAVDIEKPFSTNQRVIKKNNPKLTQNISQALEKVQETWNYQLGPFNNEKIINDSGLTEHCDGDRCVNFIVLDNCIIVSYRTKTTVEFGTQIIMFGSLENILKDSDSKFFVDDIQGKTILKISTEGYDKNGHWWQNGTFDLITRQVTSLSKKEY